MRAIVLVVASAVVLTACWRGSSEPAAPVSAVPAAPIEAQPGGAPCDVVAATTHRIVSGSSDEVMARRARSIAAVVMRRCSEDGWSVELRRCMADARQLEDADRCEPLATEAQRQALDEAIESIESMDDAGP
jgi:hypothetical protein